MAPGPRRGLIAEGRLPNLTWYGLAAVLLAMFAITVGYGIALPILPFLIERIAGTTDPAALSWHTGLLTGIYILAIFMFAPLWGTISDHHGRRPVILLGLLGFAVTVALFTFADTLSMLYTGRFLSGLFAAAITPVAYALVGDHASSKEWRAHRFALINIAGTAGFFVGPLLGGLAVRATSKVFTGTAERAFSTPFLVAAALALLATLMVFSLVPRAMPPQPSKRITPEAQLERAVLLRLWTVAFVTAIAIGAFEVGLSLRGKQVLGFDAARIGMMFAECSFVMFVVQTFVFSPLVKPELTRWFIAPGLAILALSLAVVSFTDTSITLTVTVALVAASAGILSPIVTYWVSLGAPETQGADLGRTTAAASLGQALGSVGGGLLFDASTLPGAPFTLTAVIVAAGLLASLHLPQLLLPSSASDKRTLAPARRHLPL